MTAHIAVVGSLNMDLVIRSPRIPQPGETIIGHDLRTVPGGKGANQAVAAARLGAQVSMVGCVGQDAFASVLLANLKAAGIDHSHVRQDAADATGVALIVVDDAGENTIVVASGSNRRLSPEDVDAAEGAIAQANALLLQLESPLETVQRAAQVARAHDVMVILNPAPAQPLPGKLLSLVDVLIPNCNEAALLSGQPVENLSGALMAASALHGAGAGTIVLTLGSQGAMMLRPEGHEHMPAFPVTVVDTTAAGDAFVAGFAVHLAEGGTLQDAVRWGNAAGALATTQLGAQPSLPTRNAVLDLVQR